MAPPLTQSDNRFSVLDTIGNADIDHVHSSSANQLSYDPNRYNEHYDWYKRYREEKKENFPLREVHKALKRSSERVHKTLQQPGEERPFAVLCSTCASIFNQARSEEWFGEWHDHHQSLLALNDAVRMGCAICKIISDNTLAQPRKTNGRNLARAANGNSGFLKYNIELSEHLDYSLQIGYDKWEVVLDLIMVKPKEIESDPSKLLLSPTTASTQVWDLCRYWLYCCRTGHKKCGHRQQDLAFRPSRLVHVEAMKDDLIQARLECDTTNQKVVNYLTLSHCWGNGKFFTLRRDNLEELQKRIIVDDLSKVFQHALLTTIKLGFSYIWIDSLCIIQDSEEDWLQESSRMGEVYKNSSCNIAATGFSEGSRGFYVERDAASLTCHKVSASWGGVWPYTKEPRSGHYFLVNPHMWDKEVSGAPLNRRGWVLQERLLSPCVLHFGNQQVFWECFESSSCEVFPTGLPSCIFRPRGFKSLLFYEKRFLQNTDWQDPRSKKKKSRGRGDSTETDTKLLYQSWHDIVEAYSVGRLTKPEDKFLAIAGAAKEVRHVLQDKYIAGLWERNFARDLLWIVSHSSAGVSLTAGYRAPTWSWASLDAEISYMYAYDSDEGNEVIHTRLLGAQVSYTTGDDTGLVEYGRIRVHGPLHQAIPSRHAPYTGRFVLCSTEVELEVHLDFRRSYLGTIQAGCSLKHRDDGVVEILMSGDFQGYCLSNRPLYLLPIRTENDIQTGELFTAGLILTPTGRARGEYMRLGVFVAGQEKSRQVVMMPSPKLDRDLWIRDTGESRYVFSIV